MDFTYGNADLCSNVWSSPQSQDTLTPLKTEPFHAFPMLSKQRYWMPMSMPLSTPIMMASATPTAASVGAPVFAPGLCVDPTPMISIPVGLFQQMPPSQSRLPAYTHAPLQISSISRIICPGEAPAESCASQPPVEVSPSNGDLLTACPRSVRKNGLLYAINTQYEGRVKRYSHLRGFGFLTATHRLIPLNAKDAGEQWPQEDTPPADSLEEVVEIHRVCYFRRPVRIGDIFVHHQKIRIPLSMDSSKGFTQEFTVGASVYFRADKCTYPGSLQAVDVRLLVRPGRVLKREETPPPHRSPLPSRLEALPIRPDLPHHAAPGRRESNASWASSELPLLTTPSRPSGHPNADPSDMVLALKSERISTDRGSLTGSPNTCNTDLTCLLTPKNTDMICFLNEPCDDKLFVANINAP
ncbi:unnamed protein product [Phytomonas sp. Hart1]|nr:unnamed protein product [Phytomonas sp. Hart1]|eukprot:CCW69822.1 unnamed protein product [Phytomonas sp. isolate Hart1]